MRFNLGDSIEKTGRKISELVREAVKRHKEEHKEDKKEIVWYNKSKIYMIEQ